MFCGEKSIKKDIVKICNTDENITRPIPCKISSELEHEFKENENTKYLSNIYGNEQIIKRVKSEYKYSIFNFINEADKSEIKKSCSAPPKLSQLSQDTTEMKPKIGLTKSKYTKF